MRPLASAPPDYLTMMTNMGLISLKKEMRRKKPPIDARDSGISGRDGGEFRHGRREWHLVAASQCIEIAAALSERVKATTAT